jgi:RNA polymerase sigma-70 factor (ECF subfamily)
MSAPVERASWDAFAERLRPFIARRVDSAADADDVLQEVLVRIHRGIHALEDRERLTAWMYRIARNAITDHRRTRARHPIADAPAGEAAMEPPEADDVAERLAENLAPFVALLPSPYREAITLTELEGRTQKEAAEMLGITESGMKSRVQRGRKKLRKMLEDCCEIALDARGHVTSCEPRSAGDLPDDCCR